MDPNNEVTLNWCTKQINRMRTDKLIIGESRGAEFANFKFVQTQVWMAQ